MRAGSNGTTRNPGPSWGYAFINFVNSALPWPAMRFILKVSSLFSLCVMKEQRVQSRRFLSDALGRKSTWVDSWRHFTAFSEFLARRFEVAGGAEAQFQPVGNSRELVEALTKGKAPSLQGTFHFGNSDLMGFWLSDFDVSVRMVRFQVENSDDLKWLENRYGGKVKFLWVNEPENLLFALKSAVEEGHSIAMKCDRVQHSSKVEVFEFLGKRRWFPFTIYHLSILFDLPVVYSIGVPTSHLSTKVYTSDVYYPGLKSKREKLAAARIHLQGTLDLLERLVKENPYQWFNFIDAVPVVEEPKEGMS